MNLEKSLPHPGALSRLPDRTADWGPAYRRHLQEFVMPFWPRHAIDKEHGGLLNCIDDAGKLITSDKYLWSQTRALWTFSAIYRRFDRNPQWLEMARSQYDFCRRYGPDDDCRWRFRVSREGQPLDGPLSLATNHFAIMGLIEYALAAGTEEPLDLARRTFSRTYSLIRSGQPFDKAPYALPPGMKAHGTAMMSALAFYELGEFLGDAGTLDAARYFCDQIIHEFIKPERNGLVEYVNRDGSFSDTPPGRAMVPGHGIESMWFLLDIARRSGRKDDIPTILKTLECCLERGWDPEFGGILLGIDILGNLPVYWKHGMFKLWWPVTEALAATLMAYEVDRSEKWLIWHRRIMDWALPRYPVAEHGEWRQRLDREGRPYDPFLVLPVKDPFHLPRGLLMGIESIDRLRSSGDPRFS